MLDMGIPRHLVELVAGLYNNQEAAVRWNGQLPAWFPIEQGTRQGCNISATEFNLYAKRIMRTVEEKYEGVVIGGRRITNLRYAEDTTLLASTQERIKKFFKIFATRKCTLQHVYQCTEVQNNGGQQTLHYIF